MKKESEKKKMKKENENYVLIMKKEKENELMMKVMKDSCYIPANVYDQFTIMKGHFWTSYFFTLNPKKYESISDENIDAFQSKCREQVRKYLAEREKEKNEK
tara:strand:- start:29 stop:334 length:306 start_codon:yes stop_codon:yes gene_type:complete